MVKNLLARALRDDLQTSFHSTELIKIYKTLFDESVAQKEADFF